MIGGGLTRGNTMQRVVNVDMDRDPDYAKEAKEIPTWMRKDDMDKGLGHVFLVTSVIFHVDEVWWEKVENHIYLTMTNILSDLFSRNVANEGTKRRGFQICVIKSIVYTSQDVPSSRSALGLLRSVQRCGSMGI
jgi:hypothetical protein